jgi:hypothetical protein
VGFAAYGRGEPSKSFSSTEYPHLLKAVTHSHKWETSFIYPGYASGDAKEIYESREATPNGRGGRLKGRRLTGVLNNGAERSSE